MDARSLGKEIQRLRKERGMTQEELAFKTGLSTRTVQRIENGEVDARSYTLTLLADALEVDITFFTQETPNHPMPGENERRRWLALLHLSGLFVLLIPPILVYMFKRDTIPEMERHWPDVINFQISMWIYLVAMAIPPMLIVGIFILPFAGVFCLVVTVINTIRVMNGGRYHYPLTLTFVKPLVSQKMA